MPRKPRPTSMISWRSVSDYFIVNNININKEDGNSTNGRPVKASQESLMSLMSSGGTSGFGASGSPLSPRMTRRNLRSVSSGSSRGSFGEGLNRRVASSGHGSGRSYPYHQVYAHGGGDDGQSTVTGVSLYSQSLTAVPNYSPPPGLTIRPLFEVTLLPNELDTPFLGREWLCREIQESLLRKQEGVRSLIIHGCSGGGKSTFLKQIIIHSPPFHSNNNTSANINHHNAADVNSSSTYENHIPGTEVSSSSIIIPSSFVDPPPSTSSPSQTVNNNNNNNIVNKNGSRASLNSPIGIGNYQHHHYSPIPTSPAGHHCNPHQQSIMTQSSINSPSTSPSLFKIVGDRVVAYHISCIHSASSCSLTDFLCNIGAQMASSPHLSSYADYLVKNSDVQEKLNLNNAMTIDPLQLFRTAIVEPLKSLKIKTKNNQPLLLLIDAIDEAEFHRPESTDSIAQFISQYFTELPTWLKMVVSCGSNELHLIENLDSRSISIDDVGLDERVWRDALSYISYRISVNQALKNAVSITSGLPDGIEPVSHFCEHLTSVSKGNLLYIRLTLDLLQNGCLRLKSGNYSVLPVSLPEVFLLLFNLRYPSIRSFEGVVPMLSVLLASLHPLTPTLLHQIINAGRTSEYIPWDQFTQRLGRVSDLIIKSSNDDTLVPFHPAFRDWLLRRTDGNSPKYLVDLRSGNALLALWLSRRGDLSADEMLELGHHLLKAHPYKHSPNPNPDNPTNNSSTGADHSSSGYSSTELEKAGGKECQLLWIQQSPSDLSNSLCSLRNTASPNIKVSRLLLLAGADPNAKFRQTDPLICRAASLGHADMVGLLLEFGGDVHCRNANGQTPLMLAAAGGHLDVVQLLHQHKAKLTDCDSLQRSAMVLAAKGGHVSVTSFLLQCDWGEMTGTAVDDGAWNTRRQTAQQSFVAAAEAGHTKVCRFLLEMAEVSVEELDPVTKQSALCAACSHARPETAQYLISVGANNNNNPLMASTSQQHTSAGGLIVSGETPLICAVTGGSWEIVSGLLAKGIDVDSERSGVGLTALMTAAKYGHIGVIQLLLSRGAEVNIRDHSGRTALSWAAAMNESACVRLLLDRGARFDLADNNGKTPLHHAAISAGKQVIQILLERGANLEEADTNGYRALELAVQHENTNAISCFLRKGAKLGPTTWKMAATFPDIIIILLQKLLDDANLLYRRGRVKDSSHRFSYALKKFPVDWITTPNNNNNSNSNNGGLSPKKNDSEGGSTISTASTSSTPANPHNSLQHHPHHVIPRNAQSIRAGLLIGYGRCKRRLGDFQGALECCDKVLNGRRRRDAVVTGDNNNDNVDDHRSATEEFTGAFDAHFLRAKVYFDIQDTEMARKEAEAAVDACPSSREAHHLLQSLSLSIVNNSDHHQLIRNTTNGMGVINLNSSSGNNNGGNMEKSRSPADCSSDSGNQADFEDPSPILSPPPPSNNNNNNAIQSPG